jgi:hypothetical protein
VFLGKPERQFRDDYPMKQIPKWFARYQTSSTMQTFARTFQCRQSHSDSDDTTDGPLC